MTTDSCFLMIVFVGSSCHKLLLPNFSFRFRDLPFWKKCKSVTLTCPHYYYQQTKSRQRVKYVQFSNGTDTLPKYHTRPTPTLSQPSPSTATALFPSSSQDKNRLQLTCKSSSQLKISRVDKYSINLFSFV